MLASSETFSGDDCNLFLLVELLVKLLVFMGDCLDKDQTLVLGKNSQEVNGSLVERSGFKQSLIKQLYFFLTHTCIFGE